MDKNTIRSGYDSIADEYARARDPFKNLMYLEILNAHLMLPALILDVGCGSGIPVDAYLAQQGHKITGIDLSARQIELARGNLPDQTFKIQDMEALEIGAYQVDAVVSFYAIFHIPRQRHAALFERFGSFLARGGLLLVTLGAVDWEGQEDFLGVEMQWSHYGQAKNIALLKESGFEILLDEIDTSGGEQHQVVLARKL